MCNVEAGMECPAVDVDIDEQIVFPGARVVWDISRGVYIRSGPGAVIFRKYNLLGHQDCEVSENICDELLR